MKRIVRRMKWRIRLRRWRLSTMNKAVIDANPALYWPFDGLSGGATAERPKSGVRGPGATSPPAESDPSSPRPEQECPTCCSVERDERLEVTEKEHAIPLGNPGAKLIPCPDPWHSR